MCFQSCTTTMVAMVIDTSTTSGAATPSGIQKASSGTATRPSPKPNADRISVAINTMTKTYRVLTSIVLSSDRAIRTGWRPHGQPQVLSFPPQVVLAFRIPADTTHAAGRARVPNALANCCASKTGGWHANPEQTTANDRPSTVRASISRPRPSSRRFGIVSANAGGRF
jgi:hypothetical protein